MEAIGAVIIFFSWVITNALTQRYSALKTSLESAKRSFRLYDTLHELRSMINSLAMEVIQGLPKGKNASRIRAGIHHIEEVDQMRERFCLEAVSAQQMRELFDFMIEAQELAKSVDNNSETYKKIHNEILTAENLRDRLYVLESKAEREMEQSNEFVSVSEFKAVPEYIDFYKLEVLPKVPDFYSRIVDLSNETQEHARTALARAKQISSAAKYISLGLYVLGTILILMAKFMGSGS